MLILGRFGSFAFKKELPVVVYYGLFVSSLALTTTRAFYPIMPYSTRQSRLKQVVSVKEEQVASATISLLQSTRFVSASSSSTNETSITSTSTTSTPRKKRNTATVVVTPEADCTNNDKKKRQKTTVAKAPTDWQEIYDLVQELRQDRTAPCDHSGAEALPDREQSPKAFRFQVLMSLILSSQTKDAVVGEAIRSMQKDGVLSVAAIQQMSSERLNSYIRRVGFHNNKTKYIQQTVDILVQDFDGDIPPTAADMIQLLPGVGPKMAYICENIAWNRQTGIGVDTHMHRLFNKLGWVKSKTPEQTRVQLEAWLPHEYWGDVNQLWVGFGQEVQQFPAKILSKALECSDPVKALKLLKRCGMDVSKESKKCGVEEKVQRIMKGGR